MLNSVNNANGNINTFKNFAQNKNENFFMQTNTATTTSTNDTPQKHSHKKRNIALSVGGSALLVGAGILVLSRGLPKNTTKYLEKVKEYLERKLAKSDLKGSDRWNEFYVYSLRKVNSFMEKAQSINNFTSLKDVLFKNLMGKTKFTKNIHNRISQFFEGISRKTVVSSYKSTGKKFNKMFVSLDNLDKRILSQNPDELITINGKTLTKRQWVEIAQNHRKSIKGAVETFISSTQQSDRYKYIKSVTSKLYGQFWDESFKDFWSKNNKFRRKEMWQTFIPEEKIAAGKTSLAEQVSTIRNKITYANADKLNLMETQLKKLEELIIPSDKEGLDLIKKLKWFLKNPDGIGENSQIFKKELSKVLERPLQEGLDKSIISNQTNLRRSYVKSILDLMDNKNSGELQEMLAIYEKIAPYELSLVRPQVTKAVKAFDKSLNLETVEFFDKARDLALGSAPTDVLSIIASGGMIGYGLAKAKDNDERLSVTLTSGVPIIGAIGTSLICTAKLISGSKSMVIGGVSGLILGQVGKFADLIRKKQSKNHSNSQVA